MNTLSVDYDKMHAVEFFTSDYYNGASIRATTEDGATVYVRYEWEKDKSGEIPASVVSFLDSNGIDISGMENESD